MTSRTDAARRVSALRERLDVLRERYGSVGEDLRPLESLEQHIARRNSRIEILQQRIVEARAEIGRLSRERVGYLAGIEALLDDLIPKIEQRYGEGWTPAAIPGYRMWNVVDGQVVGAVTPWTDRSKSAVCLNGVSGVDLPHSNGRCGPPACGVYATKQPEYVFARMQRMRNWAIGLVGLTGKVVEHTHGFRAHTATIEALCLVVNGRRLHLDDHILIEAALLDPTGVVAASGEPAGSEAAEAAAAAKYLRDRERIVSWTSANKSE
jgi:hypothetical protein